VKKLVAFVVIIALLLSVLAVLGDFFAKSYAEDAIGQAITHRSPNIGSASASIDSFPFVWKLLKDGRVDHVTLKLRDLHDVGGIDELDLRADGVVMDRDALLGRSHVQVKKVDGVGFTAIVSVVHVRDVAGRLGLDVGFGSGNNTVTVNGIPISVTVDGGSLVLAAAGFPAVRLPIPTGAQSVLPCAPLTTVTPDGIALSCHADHLPKLLVDAIGSLDLKRELAG
jgi:hypothetical protein